MSKMVHKIGKLKPIKEFQGMEIEEQCRLILLKQGYSQLYSFYDSWQEMFYEELYNEFTIVNNLIYEIIENEDGGMHFYNAHLNDDETIDYNVMYYNGGCSLSNAIETATKNLFTEEK